jgi:hypothetical protein
MGLGFPKDCFVVGYEMKDGSLIFYAGDEKPERFMQPSDALEMASRLNKSSGSRMHGAKTNWEVYTMEFERYRQVEL